MSGLRNLQERVKKKEAQQEEIPALRRATVGPILTQGFPPAERTFIEIIFAEHFALDNTRFIAVSLHYKNEVFLIGI